jgi:hypothetical protein
MTIPTHGRFVWCGYPASEDEVSLSLSLSESESVSDCVLHDRDALIVDANNVTVFDSRYCEEYTANDWGPRFVLHEWCTDDDVLRIAEFTAWKETEEEIEFPAYLELDNGTLDDRVLYQLPLQLRSLRVGLTMIRGTGVEFREGYNFSLRTENPTQPIRSLGGDPAGRPDGGRYETLVDFAAIPGEGEGRYPATITGPTGIRTFNGIKPDGRLNFIYDALQCYRWERPIQEVLSVDPREVRILDHALQAFNDCGPCCDCDDFIAVYEAIRRLRDRYADLLARAQTVRDVFSHNRDRFLAQQACRQQDSLRVLLRADCGNYVDVVVGLCNNRDECLRNPVVLLNFAGATTGVGVIRCTDIYRTGNVLGGMNSGQHWQAIPSSMEHYTLGGEWPHYWATWDAIEPGSLGSIVFRMSMPDAQSSGSLVLKADAYRREGVLATPPDEPPIPDVDWEVGPLTEAAQALRLVPDFVTVTVSVASGCCTDTTPPSG